MHRTAIRANKPVLAKLGPTSYPQCIAMVALWAEDGQTVGSIGGKLFLESSTPTPPLKRLEAAGSVRRARCAEDERQVRVRLTGKGRALREEARRHRPDWVARAFDDPEGAKALKRAAVVLRDRLLLLAGRD